jgi:hypothetical protein
MLRAASHGHYLSDNAMFNFGKLLDEIVIIDAGWRPLVPNQMSKSEFNTKCMGQFWRKLELTIEKSELDVCRFAWKQAKDMDSARSAFEELWGSVQGAVQSTRGGEEPQPKRPAPLKATAKEQPPPEAECTPLCERCSQDPCACTLGKQLQTGLAPSTAEAPGLAPSTAKAPSTANAPGRGLKCLVINMFFQPYRKRLLKITPW